MRETKQGGYQASIMIVDDTSENLNVLSAVLKEKGYEVRPVPSGKLALRAAKNEAPDLILLDINMPDMDGYEVCERLKKDERTKDIPIIFVSAMSEIIDKVRAFSLGAVDYITKPFQLEEVDARVETHLKLRRLTMHLEHIVDRQVEEISEAQMSTIFAMAKLTQSRDDSTGKHLERVQGYCKLIACQLKHSSSYSYFINEKWIEIVSRASALHDIGKVGIPDRILLKEGRLTESEFEMMKEHSAIGFETLKEVQEIYPDNIFILTGGAIARSHHEKWDGSGYPDGLKEEEIPLPARIMAIADVYDALKSERCYKEAFSHEKCCKIIKENRGIIFDPEIVDVFEVINKEMLDIWEAMQ